MSRYRKFAGQLQSSIRNLFLSFVIFQSVPHKFIVNYESHTGRGEEYLGPFPNGCWRLLSVSSQAVLVTKSQLIFRLFSGQNGRIEYSISGGDAENDFEIIQNGTIRTRHGLDRETIGTYNLVVTARDCAEEPEKRLSSTVQVSEIQWTDERIRFFFYKTFIH